MTVALETGATCPRCGDLWPWRRKFCGSCGEKLRAGHDAIPFRSTCQLCGDPLTRARSSAICESCDDGTATTILSVTHSIPYARAKELLGKFTKPTTAATGSNLDGKSAGGRSEENST